MEKQINLLGKIKQRTVSDSRNFSLYSGSIVLFLIVIAVSLGITLYVSVLNKQKKSVEETIALLQSEVNALREVEEKKSVVTLKVDELEKIYNNKFDYVKAIDDIQKLFSYTLEIKSVSLQDDKTAVVDAVKTGTIVISESDALSTAISEMTLKLVLSSSQELQETVDNLKSYLGRGLTQADVKQSTKNEEGRFEVDFLLMFGTRNQEAGNTQNE